MPYHQKNHGTKTREGRQTLWNRILAMCEEQGVHPEATLTPEDIKAFMTLTHAEKNLINLITTGYPIRNAATILRAIELKVDRTTPKAAANAEQQAVTVTINTLSDKHPTVSTTLPEGAHAEFKS